jgi:long-chain acyl-CoA synthetase
MEKIYKKRVMGTINESILLKWAVKLPWLRKKIMARIGVKLLAFFGGNIKVLAIGGAAINLETEKFLLDAGFPYLVGYGLTETSPILAGGPLNDSTIRLGSVGKVVPDVEVKIDASDPLNSIGEIKARGPNVMKGYYNNEKATQEVLDPEGWLSTGDLGYFDADNNLHIKGRSKSVIVLSHGENIYPEAIEEKINSFVQVVESLVIAKNERLEARVYLDYDLVDKEAGNKREKQRDYIQNVLAEIKQTVNNQLPTFSKLQEVREMPEPFVKTATHKIKRYLYT